MNAQEECVVPTRVLLAYKGRLMFQCLFYYFICLQKKRCNLKNAWQLTEPIFTWTLEVRFPVSGDPTTSGPTLAKA